MANKFKNYYSYELFTSNTKQDNGVGRCSICNKFFSIAKHLENNNHCPHCDAILVKNYDWIRNLI